MTDVERAGTFTAITSIASIGRVRIPLRIRRQLERVGVERVPLTVVGDHLEPDLDRAFVAGGTRVVLVGSEPIAVEALVDVGKSSRRDE